jgi:putative transposase
MKLLANIQLKPDIDQAAALRDMIERCNAACDWMSERAFETKTFKQFALHMLCYHEVCDRFGLAAQVAVRCIAKVADVYKAGVNVRRRFRPHAAQPYDERIVRFRDDEHISIWTLGGRSTLVFVCGTRQRALLKHHKGEVALTLIRGRWYTNVERVLPR